MRALRRAAPARTLSGWRRPIGRTYPAETAYAAGALPLADSRCAVDIAGFDRDAAGDIPPALDIAGRDGAHRNSDNGSSEIRRLLGGRRRLADEHLGGLDDRD